MLINKCGKLYSIKKNETETVKQSIERGWFAVNTLHLDNDIKDLEESLTEAEKMSRLWVNINILECKYDDNIEKKIKEIEEKVFV